jgi:CubicO group peptidase (beta-lactamase class C family)
MTWPETTHSRAEIVAGLRHLPLVRPFRSGYDYDNVLYIAAGELVAAVSGRSWEAFVSERILRPLGMSDSGPTADPRWLPSADVAWPHTRLSPAGRGVGPQRPLARSGRGRVNNGPAGGVRTSARDVARWLQLQIGWGQAPGAPRLWSDETAYELWKARTLIRDEGGSSPAFPDMPVMVAYGSGWEVRDFRGRKIVWHAGQLNGQSANVVLVPGLEAGFAILSNAEEGEALWALRHTLLDRLLGVEGVDWLDVARRRAADRKARTEKEAAARVRPSPASAPTLAAAAYAGRYVDSWYGAVSVLSSPAGLSIRFERTPKMEGRLEPWAGDTFRTRFADLNFEDALVSFAGESGRVSGATLKRLRPEGDFSFDYEHLRLRKAA